MVNLPPILILFPAHTKQGKRLIFTLSHLSIIYFVPLSYPYVDAKHPIYVLSKGKDLLLPYLTYQLIYFVPLSYPYVDAKRSIYVLNQVKVWK